MYWFCLLFFILHFFDMQMFKTELQQLFCSPRYYNSFDTINIYNHIQDHNNSCNSQCVNFISFADFSCLWEFWSVFCTYCCNCDDRSSNLTQLF